MKGLLDLKLTDCRWVHDERGQDGLAVFCGASVLYRNGKPTSWCPTHHAVCCTGCQRKLPKPVAIAA
jgi:hypothetical protein